MVDGEVIWDEPDGYYHHYPSMPRVRAWLAEAKEADGEGSDYSAVLAQILSQRSRIAPNG